MIDLLNLAFILIGAAFFLTLGLYIGRRRGYGQLLRELEGAHIMTGTTIHAVTGGEIREVS